MKSKEFDAKLNVLERKPNRPEAEELYNKLNAFGAVYNKIQYLQFERRLLNILEKKDLDSVNHSNETKGHCMWSLENPDLERDLCVLLKDQLVQQSVSTISTTVDKSVLRDRVGEVIDLGAVDSLQITNCKNCTIRATCNSSILIEKCEECIFELEAHQLRIHNTTKSKFKIFTKSGPVLENCQHLEFSSLHSGEGNRFGEIKDFTGGYGNFALIKE